MTENTRIARIEGHPLYERLKYRRRQIAFAMAAGCIGLCAIFILLAVFQPLALTVSLNASGTLTVGVVYGVGLVLLSWILTGVYIWLSNGWLEGMLKRLLKEVAL